MTPCELIKPTKNIFTVVVLEEIKLYNFIKTNLIIVVIFPIIAGTRFRLLK